MTSDPCAPISLPALFPFCTAAALFWSLAQLRRHSRGCRQGLDPPLLWDLLLLVLLQLLLSSYHYPWIVTCLDDFNKNLHTLVLMLVTNGCRLLYSTEQGGPFFVFARVRVVFSWMADLTPCWTNACRLLCLTEQGRSFLVLSGHERLRSCIRLPGVTLGRGPDDSHTHRSVDQTTVMVLMRCTFIGDLDNDDTRHWT